MKTPLSPAAAAVLPQQRCQLMLRVSIARPPGQTIRLDDRHDALTAAAGRVAAVIGGQLAGQVTAAHLDTGVGAAQMVEVLVPVEHRSRTALPEDARAAALAKAFDLAAAAQHITGVIGGQVRSTSIMSVTVDNAD